MNHDIIVKVAITTEQCRSILQTAESQLGGWEIPISRRIYKDEGAGAILSSFWLKCIDLPGLGLPIQDNWWLVDEHVIARGLQKIIANDIDISPRRRLSIVNSFMDGEDIYDIDDCDCIIQAGLFGQLVYVP